MSKRKSSRITNPALPVTPAYRKPRVDLYTVLLVVALLALLFTILVLHFENSSYGYKFKGAPPVSMQGAPAAVAAESGLGLLA